MASSAAKVFLAGCLISSASAAVPPALERYLAGIDALRGAYAAGGMGAVYDLSVVSGARQIDPRLSAAQQQLLRDEFARTSWAAYEYAGLALRTRRETLSGLKSWHKPTLIVHGENESPGLKKVADDLTTTIQGAQRVVIPRAGHSPQFENPDAFNATLLPFLASLH